MKNSEYVNNILGFDKVDKKSKSKAKTKETQQNNDNLLNEKEFDKLKEQAKQQKQYIYDDLDNNIDDIKESIKLLNNIDNAEDDETRKEAIFDFSKFCMKKNVSILKVIYTFMGLNCYNSIKNFMNYIITKYFVNSTITEEASAAAYGFNPQNFMQQQQQYQLPLQQQPVTKEQLQMRVDNLKTLIEFIPGRNLNNTQITNFENLLRVPNILQLGKIKELELVDSSGQYDFKFQSIMYPNYTFVFNSHNGNLQWIQQIQLAN